MMGDPELAPRLRARLRLPVMAGPMFIASTTELVIAQCRAGIVGSLPALNARTTQALDIEIGTIREALQDGGVPYAINLVAHRANTRMSADLAVVVKHKVPIVILAMGASAPIVDAIHAYGGLVFNDVVSDYHARKCADQGVDGIIAIASGAGGHTGAISPFALASEMREWWQGPLILAGGIGTGRAILAAEALGADLAYIGSPFLASFEAQTQQGFKQMIVDSSAKDIVVTNYFTGVNAAFLRPSIIANGLDPNNLVRAEGAALTIAAGENVGNAWRDVWSAGQGIGAVKAISSAADFIDGLTQQYVQARSQMGMSI